MKPRVVLLASIACAACGPTAAPSVEALRSGIIGGTRASESDFRGVGAMLSRMESNAVRIGKLTCTGALVAPDVVLVASHCFVEDAGGLPERHYFTLALDVTSFPENAILPSDAVEIVETLSHPSFDVDRVPSAGLERFYDIGLAFLGGSLGDAPLAVVASAGDDTAVTEGTRVDIVGYGQRTPTSTRVGAKFFAETGIEEAAEWELAVGRAGQPRKCHGDSGGPTFLTVADGRLPRRRILGVTSRAYDEDADCAAGGIDTRASAYRAWVNAEMRRACDESRRVAAACATHRELVEPVVGEEPDAGTNDGAEREDVRDASSVADTTAPDASARDAGIGERGDADDRGQPSDDPSCACTTDGRGTRGDTLDIVALVVAAFCSRRVRQDPRRGLEDARRAGRAPKTP